MATHVHCNYFSIIDKTLAFNNAINMEVDDHCLMHTCIDRVNSDTDHALPLSYFSYILTMGQLQTWTI